jgi:glycogen synthase
VKNPLDEKLLKQIANAQFFMLRYETEFTPCTGITAVSKQERRAFLRGITVAPWCGNLFSSKPENDPLKHGKIIETGLAFKVFGNKCRVLVTTDDLPPILFLDVEGRFQGNETPYDLPLSDLHEDTLYFGIAVEKLLRQVASPQQFVWGADWESVPALTLVKDRHLTSLTLHNTFDECLEAESQKFGRIYKVFASTREDSGMIKTALEIGLETADVVTTVNRGFAWGMRNEPIQSQVMAAHLQPLLGKVVGINNAAFSPLSAELRALRKQLISDPVEGRKEIFRRQAEARRELPAEIQEHLNGKVLVVSMGRRVAQKQHDVLVESVRTLLNKDKNLPLFVFFATSKGDPGSQARLERITCLQEEFPANVAWTDGRLPYFSTLMQAADYNCMPSLYEPHGGAYEGTVIPIARAIDGLAEQICGLNPKGVAAELNARWHTPLEAPSGFLFREDGKSASPARIRDLRALLSDSPSPQNPLFIEMRAALSKTLLEAIHLRLQSPEKYASLVLAAIEKQEACSWDENRGGMLALIEEARGKR